MCPALVSTSIPSGSRMLPSTIVLRSDPSGFIVSTLPALASRKNNFAVMSVTPSSPLRMRVLMLRQERGEHGFRFRRIHAYRELLVLELHRLLELLAQSSLQEPLASQQRASGLFRQALRGLGCGSENALVGHDPGDEPELRGLRGGEGPSQENQLRRAEVAEVLGKQEAAAELRHEREVDERHLELRALSRIHEVAVTQHGRPTPDGHTVHGGDERLL